MAQETNITSIHEPMQHNSSNFEFMPKQVLNRHWFWVFLWTAAGIFLGRATGGMGVVLMLCCCVAGLAVFIAPFPIRQRAYLGFALLCLALGAALFVARRPDAASDRVHQYALTYPPQRMVFEGVVRNAQVLHRGRNYLRFEMEVTEKRTGGHTTPVESTVLVRWSGANMPVYNGSRVRVAGKLSPHLDVVNHGIHSIEDLYRGRGIFSVIHARGDDAVKTLRPGRFSPRYWASRLRQWQRDRLTVVTPAAVQPFVNGVWLGARELIDREEYERFIHSGTAHILAVSGIHVAIIAFSLNFLLKRTPLPRRLQIFIMMVFGVLLFALMAGARTATMRATFLLAVYYAYEWFDREPDSLSVLGLCGIVFLVWNPNLLFQVGFLLSFGSVGSILLFYPGMQRAMSRLPRILAASLATTLSSQVLTWPIAAWYFNIVPLAGIIANIIVVPLLTVTLWLCFATMVIAVFSTSAAMIPGYALLPVVTLIQQTNAMAASLPLAYNAVPRPTMIAIVAYTIATLYLFRVLYDAKDRRRNMVAVAILLLTAALFWRAPHATTPRLDFIDVGHGDAIFVRTPCNTTMLVDGGSATQYIDRGARTVAPFLHAHGVTRLDYVVVSHNHNDHIGGLFHIIERFSVGAVVMGPERAEPVDLEQAFLALCNNHDVPVIRMQPGDTLPAEEAFIEAIHPEPSWTFGRSENDQSLVLHVAWHGVSVLLTGDIERAAETLLTDHITGPVPILKVPHHGSGSSSTEAFLQRVQPKVAITSLRTAGARTPFMPLEVEQRYAQLNIPLFRTDWHGGVRITGDSDGIQIETARGARGYCLTYRSPERMTSSAAQAVP